MGRKCCALGCRSNYDNEKNYISVFQFPVDPERRSLWLRQLNRIDFTPSSTAVICINHFEERFLVREDSAKRDDGSLLVVPKKYPRLSLDAYPTVFPNLPVSLTKSSPTPRKYSNQRREEMKKREKEKVIQQCSNDAIETFEDHTENCDSKLSDSCIRISRRKKIQNGPSGTKKPSVYHKQMSFLSETLEHERTCGNMDETHSIGSSSQQENESQLNETPPTSETDEVIKVSHAHSIAQTKRIKTEDNFEEDPLPEETTSYDHEPENPDRMFLLSLLPRFSELNRRDKLDFQIKVMQLLQNYDLYANSQLNIQNLHSSQETNSMQSASAAPSPYSITNYSIKSEESVLSFDPC